MSKEITVSLPGDGVRTIPAGSPASETLAGKLGKLAIGVMIDGRPRDLSTPLEGDCSVAPILPDSPEGLDLIRHSSAHLLAHAVKRLFPEAQVTIGPVIENGFFYDFKFDRGFVPEDLEKIEAEMAKIVAENHTVTREDWKRDDAVAFFNSIGETFKAEIIGGLADGTVGLYRQGDFVDLCRGPHVPATGRLGAFKLLSVAGAYWRGDEKNPMLQRIYGTAWADKKALEQHLARLEEAKRRDHRRLGKQLGLFSFHREAPGSPFFHPDGALVYNLLVEYIRGLYRKYDYSEVITPQILDVDLWHQSGHYENYRENMYFTSVEEREFAVKPMNCPTHCLMYGEDLHSYRELPIRFADFGRLHRFERSGVVHGLTRVRSFCQDDAHIFCAPEQIQEEIRTVIGMIRHMNETFGFDETRVYLSTRPEKSIGTDSAWENAENALRDVLAAESVDYKLNAGDGAFYGPKIDFCVLDAVGREWQLSTVQLDFSLPERFDLHYIDAEGAKKRPVMIHRAVLGSLERFLGILIEHTAGALPLWLAPTQVRLVTVTDRQNEFADEVAKKLRAGGFRARADLRNEKLGFKIREAQAAKIPVVAVVGDKEVEAGTVAPRLLGGQQVEPMTIDAFVGWLAERSRIGTGRCTIAKSQDFRINNEIRAREVRLIDDKGEQLGIMSMADAREIAEKRNMDLVEVAGDAQPPVVRIMDFHKFRYEERKKVQESRKKSTAPAQQMKEVKLRSRTEAHDIEFKTSHIKRFLAAGHRVKVTVFFKGREITRPDMGRQMLLKVLATIADVAQPDGDPRLEGRNMSVIVVPVKTAPKGEKTNAQV